MSKIGGKLGILIREPVTLFVLLGCALFGVDRIIAGPEEATGDNRIVVTIAQQAALREAFRNDNGRDPEPRELQARLDRWIDEQVLYQQALALGLDRKDLIVHRQLTQKMRLLLDSSAELAEPSDADLQAWLDQHAERYAAPGRISFQHVFISRGRHGAGMQPEAQRLAAQLAEAPHEFVGLGDAFLTGQVVSDAAPVQLRREFGPEFANGLTGVAENQWSEPIASSFGLHLVRITHRTPPRAATLEAVRERVRLDLRTAQREQQTRQALDQLRRQYQVEIEDSAG